MFFDSWECSESPLREVQRISSTVASTEKSETWPSGLIPLMATRNPAKLSSSNGELYHYSHIFIHLRLHKCLVSTSCKIGEPSIHLVLLWSFGRYLGRFIVQGAVAHTRSYLTFKQITAHHDDRCLILGGGNTNIFVFTPIPEKNDEIWRFSIFFLNGRWVEKVVETVGRHWTGGVPESYEKTLIQIRVPIE